MTVLHPRDVPGAQEGGADRLHLVAAGADMVLSPEPGVVSSVCRETDLPVFVLLRLNDSWTTTGGELTRLVGLAEDYLGCGAAGVSFGFLDPDLEIDTEVCTHLATSLPGVPWTFHDAVDATLDPRRSWRRLLGLPGLVAVRSAGSPQGLSVGYDDLLATAADPQVARLLMPGGGLLAEQVPWFVRGGGVDVPPRVAGAPGRIPQVVRRRRPRPLLAAAGRQRRRACRRVGQPHPMTVLIDPPNAAGHGRLWSHLASDTSYDELHAFARTVGIPERGFDRDHYDVPAEWYDQVVAAGAEPVSSRELVRPPPRRRPAPPQATLTGHLGGVSEP